MPDKTDEKLHEFIDGPPVTKGSDIGFHASHPLAGADVVSQYTDDDAVKDGTLIDITGLCPNIGKIRRVLITRTLYRAALLDRADEIAGVADLSGPIKKLLAAFGRAVEAAGPQENEAWFFQLEGLDEQVMAGHCGNGRITFCFISEN